MNLPRVVRVTTSQGTPPITSTCKKIKSSQSLFLIKTNPYQNLLLLPSSLQANPSPSPAKDMGARAWLHHVPACHDADADDADTGQASPIPNIMNLFIIVFHHVQTCSTYPHQHHHHVLISTIRCFIPHLSPTCP